MKKYCIAFLLVLFCMPFIACSPKQVENKSVVVLLNGVPTECYYTGEYLKKPVGVGEYKFTNNGDFWIFTGELGEDTELSSGSVENMPLVIKSEGKRYETIYTGLLVDLVPVDSFPISDFQYKLIYDGEEYEGLYSGVLLNNLPNGNGSFIYENKGDYFEYSGGWQEGCLSGEGSIESNCFTIHFSYVDREGEFSGDVIDGIPNGKGTFTANNSDNVSYTYKGYWVDGLFEGKGHLEYDADDYWVLDGDFADGEFTPSIADFYFATSTKRDGSFYISENEYDFINSHESMFKGKMEEIDDAFIDTSFKYEEFSKNPSKYELSVIKMCGLKVSQIFEYETYGYNFVFVIAYDSKYHFYYINMIGAAPNIVEGSRIQLITMPVDYFSYPNVAGSRTWAIACIGMIINKQ